MNSSNSDDGSMGQSFEGSFTQPTQPTQPTQATQKPPKNTSGSKPGVFASLVPRHPHLAFLAMETDRLLNGGYTLGRLNDCDIVVDREYVSGKHCCFYMEADADFNSPVLYILDTSTNGTFVNDRIIGRGSRTILVNNDRLGFQRAIDALPSDIALEYTIEFNSADLPVANHIGISTDVLHAYDVKHEIGSGNFARVWLTIRKQTGAVCACKVINKKKHLFSSGLTKVFEREISIMKQLRHENIVPLHDLFIDKDRIHIFMEYLEGGDLLTYMANNGAFSEVTCRPIFKQLCSAVRYLHSNGITHRDIKLDNILIKGISNGAITTVKIADFGLARAVGDGDLMRTICGTPSYLAPEIACRTSSATPYGKGVDIWALGVVLYALHTNSFPLSKHCFANGAGSSSLEAYVKASKLSVENPLYAALSANLKTLLAGMLDLLPEQRLTIDEVIHHSWTQTGDDGTSGLMHEAAEIWGALKADFVYPSDTHSLSVDLFRRQTIIGRSAKCHVQLLDARISSRHCEITFNDSNIHLHNVGRCPCWVGGIPLATGQTRVLASPYEFTLRPRCPNKPANSDSSPEYRFRIEVYNKPWKVTWLPVNKDSLLDLPENTASEYRHKLPPPLVLPVKSPHLSHLPFAGAKDIYVLNGRLLRDPSSNELRVSITQMPMPNSVDNHKFVDCTLRIDDVHISQHHCTIEREDDQALITNLSSNGTFVNSKRLEAKEPLALNDEIVLLYDHIEKDRADCRWLGQQHVADHCGFPDLDTDVHSEQEMKKMEEEHKQMLEKYAESQQILDKYSVMPGKSSDYMALMQRITDENASDKRREKQPLVLKKISDSFTEMYLPFKDNLDLREKYINYYGDIRLGKVLEDLDRLAGAVAYKHASDANGDLAPMVFVTASVDRIDLKARLCPDRNYRLTGMVTYVGFSSMEISIRMHAVPEANDPEPEPNLMARFTMVGRDKYTGKSSQVNPLLLEDESQRRLVRLSEQIKEYKRATAESTLQKRPPSAEERRVIHQLWLDTRQFQTSAYGSHASLPKNAVWLDETMMESVTVCFPSERNVHNKIFGGYLMRLAHELSFANGSVFTMSRPSYVSLDDFSFKKPVNIGSILKLTSQVVYSEPENSTFQIAVSADVIDNLENSMERTNTFFFNFSCPGGHVPCVVPRSYEDMMKYLEGRRRAQTGKLISKLQNAMPK
ncbi:hypothetical protein H4R22_000796 [Coemansia sp. RSA 1290]|nr:hypothetical protein H4R22_000796 [Coemansia sp. RSA 1290]